MSLFAKKILSLKEQGPRLLKRTLPNTFLEPDIEEDDNMLPEEFQLMLDSIKVFGYLEKNFLADFCKNIETVKLEPNEFLFKKGDIDDNVFVVKSGKIRVYIEEGENRMTIREVQRGGNIHSLLSVLDVIIGNTQPYKTVNAQAITSAEVLRLKAQSFVAMFAQSPETMVRVVQLIALRLQRVTFLSLHHYLGLTSELINKESLAVPNSLVIKLGSKIPVLTNISLMRQLSAGIDLRTVIKAPPVPPGIKPILKPTTVNQPVADRGRSRSQSPPKTKTDKAAVNKDLGQSSTKPNGSGSQQRTAVSIQEVADDESKTRILFEENTTDMPVFLGEFHSMEIDGEQVRKGAELEFGETPSRASYRGSSVKERNRKASNSVSTVVAAAEGSGSKPRPRVQSLTPGPNSSTSTTGGIDGKFEDTNTINRTTTPALLAAAKEDIGKILGLQDLSCLSRLKISLVPATTSLVKEGEEDTDVYFVVTGELHALQHCIGNDISKMTSLFVTHPGELCGVEPIITTEISFYTIRTVNPARVVVLDRHLIYSLIRDDPNILLKLSNLLVRRMSPFLRQIDFALEWTSIKAGYPLYKAGDEPKSVYIILSGRFRQISVKADGTRGIVNELGRGELVGFVEVLCDQPRATTLMAIRDSELAQIPAGLLSWVKFKAPQVVTRLIQLLADKLMVSMSPSSGAPSRREGLLANGLGQSVNSFTDVQEAQLGLGFIGLAGPAAALPHSLVKGPVGTMANLRTVAIVPSSPDVPLEAFTLELQHAMVNIGSSVRLTSAIITKRLGSKALDSMNEYRLVSWLSQQEDQHRMVFYVGDSHSGNTTSVWTRRCIRQADCVVVVALASKDVKLGPVEQSMESDQTRVSKILVLLYSMDTDYPRPGRTSEWLNTRPWVTQHYHIRVPNRVLASRRRQRDRLVPLYKRVFELETPNPHADMSRLARYLTGTSIGLVLGGGGARGCSHVGAIKAMHEAGIPIDMVGGTSIGALMGALWAEEMRITQFTQRARAYSKEMMSVWKMLLDLTYSPVSIFSGKAMNNALEKLFRDRQIEDLWIPFFCVTTDITNSRMRIHTNGSLWRFVRASMSLSGYLPPLCHPEDGSLLLDGGYVNNLPADVMHSMGPEQIFAIDVGSNDDTDLSNYGDWLSGGKLLYHKLFSRNPMKVLNLTEIQSRLAFVSCVRQMEQVKESNICEYMRPPIEKYKTLQFGAFDEIQEVGYNYTRERIADWQAESSIVHFERGQLAWTNISGSGVFSNPSLRKLGGAKNLNRPNSKSVKEYVLGSSSLDVNQRNFVDLAELVSRIGQTDASYYESDNEDPMMEVLSKMKMGFLEEDRTEDDDQVNESRVEILFRPKQSSHLMTTGGPGGSGRLDVGSNKNLISMYVSSGKDGPQNSPKSLSGSMPVQDATDHSNMNSSILKMGQLDDSLKSPGSGGGGKFEDGYDEDLDEDDHFGETASDPESFHRVLNSHKRRHRRRSLNRIHKAVNFGRTVDMT